MKLKPIFYERIPVKKEIQEYNNEVNFDELQKIIKQKEKSYIPTDNILMVDRIIRKRIKNEKFLKNILEYFGFGFLNIEKIGNNLYEIKLPENIQIDVDKLPNGYGYKGGVARSILLNVLGISKYNNFRDIDIVRVTKKEDPELDLELAKKYCPDDLKNGHGVEKLEKNYFKTRDFTINELLFYDNKIILTPDCLMDTIRGIIRFTKFEKKENFNNDDIFFVNDKLMAKAVRFLAEEFSSGRFQSKICDENIFRYLSINNFHIALHLDRAFHSGKKVAKEYVRILQDFEQISFDGDEEEFIRKFIQDNNDFYFRYCPIEDYLLEENIGKENKLLDYDWDYYQEEIEK